VQIKDAIIRNRLDFSYLTITQQVSLLNCEFEDPADFSYATFKRHLIVQNSTFNNGFDFESATVELNARLDGLKVLSGKAHFKHFHVQGLFSKQGAQFDPAVPANFSNAHFDQGADLNGSVFGGEATLAEMRVGGDLFLNNAHFKKHAVLGTTKIAGSLFLESAQFDGPAAFPGIETAYSAKLPKATFRNQANFSEIEINAFLDLSAAKFEGLQGPAHFTRAHVVGGGFFDNVHFAAGARFDSSHFNTDASFENTVFDGLARFEKAHFDQAAHFDRCVFKKDVTFNETAFGTAEFAQTGTVTIKDWETNQTVTQISFKAISTCGSTYHRIQLHCQSALRMPDRTPRLLGNDQQPYSELEKFYKDTGNYGGGDGVSLEWHRVSVRKYFTLRNWPGCLIAFPGL